MIVFLALLLLQDPLPKGAELRLAGHADGVRVVAWSPNGSLLVTGSRDATLALWDAATGKRVRVLQGHAGGVTSAAFSPDGRTILSGGQDRAMILWEEESGKLLRKLEGHAGWIKTVAFAPDGKQALSASLDRTVASWDLETGKRLRSFEVHPTRLLSAAFSPDGRKVVTGNEDKQAFLFDTATGNREKAFDAPFWWNRSVAFTPGGEGVVVGSSNQQGTLFDVASGSHVTHFDGIPGLPWSVAVGPDGTQIAVGTQGRTVEFFDVDRGGKRRTFAGHSGQVSCVAFNPAGTRIASASEDGTAIVWTLLPDLSEWARGWRELGEADRMKQARELVTLLAGPRTVDASATRAALIETGDEGVRAILEAYPPKPDVGAPTEERLAALLKQLDDDDFETRVNARRDLKAFGSRVGPWIDRLLSDGASLTAEVRNTLKELSADLVRGGVAVELGRLRAVLTLVEMRGSAAARKALEQYASGGEAPALAEVARRAAGK